MLTSLSLIADIGGTNARFALWQLEEGITQTQVLACADFESLSAAIKHYLALVKTSVEAAVIAVATPITGDSVKLTNRDWEFSISTLQREFSWQSLDVINDFTAQALAILGLKSQDKLVIHAGIAYPQKTIAVIGPGTGLGVSGLVASSDGYQALASEGGHVDLPIQNTLQEKVVKFAQTQFPGHISAERVLSGNGLVLIHQALTNQCLSAPEITQRAISGDDNALQTTRVFCEFLGAVAGNLALTLGAIGGVYLCGGILPQMIPVLKNGTFNQHFLAKGRMQAYLENVPVYLVTATLSGLAGASVYAASHRLIR